MACSQLIAQVHEQRVNKMQAKADIFLEQLKVVQSISGQQKEIAPDVVEAAAVLVPREACCCESD